MMQLNKYDLILWVAKMITENHIFCRDCMFKCRNGRPKCYDKKEIVNELLKKYNL